MITLQRDYRLKYSGIQGSQKEGVKGVNDSKE